MTTLVADAPTKPAPVEEVVAHHTAMQPSRKLRVAYTVQSLATGLPLWIVDVAICTGCLIGVAVAIHWMQGQTLNPGVWLQLPALLILQTLMMSLHQLYPGAGIGPVAELRGIARSALLTCLCLSAINVVLGQLPRIEFVTLLSATTLIALVLPVSRWTARRWLGRTKWWGIRLLLIGDREDCRTTFRQLRQRSMSGFKPVGYAAQDRAVAREYQRYDASHLGSDQYASELANSSYAPVAGLVSAVGHDKNDRLVFQFPSVVWIPIADSARADLDTSSLPEVFTTRMNLPFLQFIPRIFKRSLDLAICVPGLLILAIPMAVIALAIKYFSPGPVIHGSPRVGQHGKLFNMWKFRSMVPHADKILEQKLAHDPQARSEWELTSKLKDDPRIIPGVGHLIRRWSLDELPQLWNVLVGQMSLVGPRPVPPAEIVRYQKHYYEYTQMWPGMTGLWQVSGRNDTTFETRVFLVHHYARNWSPWMDLWLLLKTPAVVVSRSGAY